MRHANPPSRPAKVLTVAFLMAMAATLAIARDRVTGSSRPLYFGEGTRIKGMARIWKEAKAKYKQTLLAGEPDASVLLKAENNIRRNFSRIMLKTSVKYGNREKKRKKRDKGNQEYLNRIWDYAGSRMRDVVKARYRFPEPSEIIMPDKTVRIGYPGSVKIATYPLRHNHLPELDFGDMIRSHLMELGRQCLKYSVPVKAAKRYIDELVERLTPFLDYVYTERRTGSKNFIRSGLKELRTIVERIRAQYGTRNGRPLPITAAILEGRDTKTAISTSPEYPDDYENQLFNASIKPEEDDTENADDLSLTDLASERFFETLVQRAESEGIAEWKDLIDTLRGFITNKILTMEDAEEILKAATEESRRIGVAFHDFISQAFPTASRMSSIVYHGQESVYDKSGLLLVSELTVEGGRGRPDFVLFGNKVLRRVDDSPPMTIFAPEMIVELKTKSAFDLDIYGVESKSEKEQNVVSEFILERRRMTDDEWKDVLTGVASEIDTAQVGAYSQAILNEYQQVMWKDSTPPEELVQAVIAVDSKENWTKTREAVLPLILDAYQRNMDGDLAKGDLLCPRQDDCSLRMALRVVSSGKPPSKVEPITIHEKFKPFVHRVADDRRDFTLYLTVSGKGSPAQSAASIAERWHGFKYLYEKARYKHSDIIWFDLSGEYKDPILTRQRFYMARHKDSLKRFFRNRVQFVDLSTVIKNCLYKGETLGNLKEEVRVSLQGSRKPFVVVSGWDTVWRSTPDSQRGVLNEFVKSIYFGTPNGCDVLWFGRPVPVSKKSSVYETRCVAPFYSNTQWETCVDKIVWNMPWPPPRVGSRTHADNHMRLLIEETPREKSPEPKEIVVEPLEGWGETFRAGGRERIYTKGVGIGGSHTRMLTRKEQSSVLDLIAHLQSEPPKDILDALPDYVVDRIDVPTDLTRSLGLNGRISLRPYQYHSQVKKDGRIKRIVSMKRIDWKREYREMELGVEKQKIRTRPPSESYLDVYSIDDRRVGLSEISALKRMLRFLANGKQDEDAWMNLIERLTEIVGFDESESELMNRLRLIRQTLENHSVTRDMWKRLWPYRSRIPSSLNPEQRRHLQILIEKHPDLMMITGNHLFLLIHVALGEGESITYTKTLENLWEYVRPWHLMGLGYRPRYPAIHETGESVFNRQNVLTHLKYRATNLNALLDRRKVLSNVRFGELIVPERSGSVQSVLLWLVFQHRPGSHQMNAALVVPRGANPEFKPRDLLNFLVSSKTFWTDSDISSLSFHAKPQKNSEKLSVMIAEYKGLQALWILDRDKGMWSPVGRIQFTTRKYEDVTLVRTLTLRPDHDIRPVALDDVQWIGNNLKDAIHTALSIIWVGLGGCVHVQCHVSLDSEKKKYSVVFTDLDGKPIGTEKVPLGLLFSQTIDLLEILRRPDNECEPVKLKGRRMIWNRFRDIHYDSETRIIRPWVERKAPFGQLPMSLPPSAQSLLKAKLGDDFELVPYHDSWICPLRNISLEDIRNERRNATHQSSTYLYRFETPYGQPKRISNESGLSHGSCWRLGVYSVLALPNEVMELERVRLTDSQLASLLDSGEVSYWSEESKCWITHSFRAVYKREFIAEAQESWHLKKLVERTLGLEKALVIPGTYLEPRSDWEPYFNIEPEYVLVGLMLRDVGEKRELRVNESTIALKPIDEIRKFLASKMNELLEKYTMTPDRKLRAKLILELENALEVAGISDIMDALEVIQVVLRTDSAGGECLYADLKRMDGGEYPVQLTHHIHSLTWGDPVRYAQVEDFVDISLSSLNISEKDKRKVVKDCVDILRRKGLM